LDRRVADARASFVAPSRKANQQVQVTNREADSALCRTSRGRRAPIQSDEIIKFCGGIANTSAQASRTNSAVLPTPGVILARAVIRSHVFCGKAMLRMARFSPGAFTGSNSYGAPQFPQLAVLLAPHREQVNLKTFGVLLRTFPPPDSAMKSYYVRDWTAAAYAFRRTHTRARANSTVSRRAFILI
jgi:hypothetical protein